MLQPVPYVPRPAGSSQILTWFKEINREREYDDGKPLRTPSTVVDAWARRMCVDMTPRHFQALAEMDEAYCLEMAEAIAYARKRTTPKD